METVTEKLMRYAAIDTMSDPDSPDTPSSQGQWTLAKLLKKEMEELGLEEISLDGHCYLFGSLAANTEKKVPVLGLLAHLDTSPDFPGEAKKARLVTYQGGDLELGHGRTLTAELFPYLPELVGKELLVTDGSTLLGADDKAGIAEILAAVEYLQAHPEIPHGKIRIGFTPDEEIGRGPHLFDVQAFGADVAYTMDGGELGQFNYESFNAAQAKITILGENIHPGQAKDKMINAQLVAMELQSMLPVQMRPEYTSDHEGFYMLSRIQGELAKTTMEYILRDHDRAKFEEKKAFLSNCVDFLNQKYGQRLRLEMEDTYYNMKEIIEDHWDLVTIALDAMAKLGIASKVEPIRGGTDGSQLSYMGLPTPNLFVGAYGFHGPYEVAVPEWMDAARDLLLEIIQAFARKA